MRDVGSAPAVQLQTASHVAFQRVAQRGGVLTGNVPLFGFFAASQIARHHLYGGTGALTVFASGASRRHGSRQRRATSSQFDAARAPVQLGHGLFGQGKGVHCGSCSCSRGRKRSGLGQLQFATHRGIQGRVGQRAGYGGGRCRIAPVLSDDRFKAIKLVDPMPGLGDYGELSIETPMHMSQLCADGSRITLQSKERCGLDKVVAARAST